MLDPDISTYDALAHLHAPERDANLIARRNFLKMVGMGLGAGMLAGSCGGLLGESVGGPLARLFGDPSAWAAGPVGPHDGILLIVGLYGGNDGLNTVVPFDDGHYHDQRGSLALSGLQTLPLDAHTGLHPALTNLHAFWQRDELAIVEGLGYADQDLSHFNSLKFWMSARPGQVSSSGWVGRWLDGYQAGTKDLYAAASLGGSVPLHFVGEAQRGTAVPTDLPFFGTASSVDDYRLYNTLRSFTTGDYGHWYGKVGEAYGDFLDLTAEMASVIPQVPNGSATESIVTKFEVAARLINANLGFRVLSAGWNDFDSHARQPDMHNARMAELNTAIGRFFEILSPVWSSRVTVMTWSEFGRTPYANGGNGTDHGSAAPHLVFGHNVRGGLHGARPSLAGLGRWDRMVHTVDFRSYYASLIDGWLGGGSTDVLGDSFENLNLLKRAPGILADGSTAPLPTISSEPARFVPVTPFRVVDTRQGPGAIGPDSVLRVQVGGVGSVPAQGVTAVLANVTAVDASEPHFFTVHASGTARPTTSNLNGGPGRPVPNLAVAGLGSDGAIDVYNSHGDAHCLVDVFGYLTTGAGDAFTPLPPTRLFDTRDGFGVRPGPIGDSERVDIPVAGQAGVPGHATAVVINLTATDTVAPGYLRLTPAGWPAAETSNVNFWAGDVVPNLVVVRLGNGGAVTLDGAGASKHAIGDVFGYFGASGARLRPLSPRRALDTREGLGTAQAPVGPGRVVDITIAGRLGVPADATAVVLNLAATNVETPSFLTVWPRGQAQPGTSNLNTLPGQTIANLVICQLGENGGLELTNPIGNCDVIADVLACFVP